MKWDMGRILRQKVDSNGLKRERNSGVLSTSIEYDFSRVVCSVTPGPVLEKSLSSEKRNEGFWSQEVMNRIEFKLSFTEA